MMSTFATILSVDKRKEQGNDKDGTEYGIE